MVSTSRSLGPWAMVAPGAKVKPLPDCNGRGARLPLRPGRGAVDHRMTGRLDTRRSRAREETTMTWAEFGVTLGISCVAIGFVGTLSGWLLIRLLDS